MPTATLNGVVIAQASDDDVVIVENNVYFPRQAVNPAYLQPSSHHSHCPWKGEASYYTVTAGGATSENAAWYYPAPFEAAKDITDRIAFWRGVQVQR
ncbi:hypothetical protein ASF61_11625 [Duganella sp. Leaf126]|uniref:DUF427 domain-containing protein n=1 Tax=Duganella sp. Leaf126 TaxID=1736266 RepID=UPI0006F6950B|nr:DUF427 domain-containing protein [Duganella sp. Leaf126]KQQ33696.1 hypothetical protein ASF61_11625 [Duganella sp. Leaf126]